MAAEEISRLKTVFDISAPREPANTNKDPAAETTAAKSSVILVKDIRAALGKAAGGGKETDLPRVIRLTGEINEEIADVLGDILRALDKQQPGVPIQLRINSPGGEVMAGLRIFDAMKSLQSPVATVCDGQCSSMAAVLLAAGSPGMRSATPNSIIMIHELSASLPRGKYTGLKSWQKYVDLLEDKLVTILSDYTGLSKPELAETMRNDTFYSADEALKLNLIDKVIAPLQLPPPKPAAKAAASPPPPPAPKLAKTG